MLALLRRRASPRSLHTSVTAMATTALRASFSTRPPLLSTDEVQALLDEKSAQVKLVDGSWYLDKNRNGRDEYVKQRLPGARFFDIAEVSDKTSTLPHMLPSEETFETAMKYLGIANDDIIVVYGGPNCFSVARCWWTFKFFGHENVHILNGGLAKWTKEKRPVISGAPSTDVSEVISYKAAAQHDLVVSWQEVVTKMHSDTQIIDARGAGRFNGSDPEPRAGMRSGHIPRAVNVPFAKLVSKDDYSLFRDTDEIKSAFAEANVKMDETSPVITSCGSGVTACVLTFGLHLLGKPLNKAPVYDGSWSEWGLREDLPVEMSK